MVYKVLVRKSIIYETEILVRSRGRHKAENMALSQIEANPAKIKWLNTGTDAFKPYIVNSDKIDFNGKEEIIND